MLLVAQSTSRQTTGKLNFSRLMSELAKCICLLARLTLTEAETHYGRDGQDRKPQRLLTLSLKRQWLWLHGTLPMYGKHKSESSKSINDTYWRVGRGRWMTLSSERLHGTRQLDTAVGTKRRWIVVILKVKVMRVMMVVMMGVMMGVVIGVMIMVTSISAV